MIHNNLKKITSACGVCLFRYFIQPNYTSIIKSYYILSYTNFSSSCGITLTDTDVAAVDLNHLFAPRKQTLHWKSSNLLATKSANRFESALKIDIIVLFSPIPLCLCFPLCPLLLLLSFRLSLFLFLSTPRPCAHLPHLENKAVVRCEAFTSLSCMRYGSVMSFYSAPPSTSSLSLTTFIPSLQ